MIYAMENLLPIRSNRHRNSISTHGIMLGNVYAQDRWMIMSLSSTGEIWAHLKEDVMFDLPLVVPQNLALRCGIQPYSDNDGEIGARIELLKRIRQIEQALAHIQS